MTATIKTINNSTFHIIDDPKIEFKQAIWNGLSQNKKSISSKFFYDEKGSFLFDQITRHPDYYLTNCEIEILRTYKHNIASYFNSQPFNLIELGPGEGIKPKILVDFFQQNNLNFTYIPIDISEEYLAKIINVFNAKQSNLNLTAINADFLVGLRWLTISSEKRNVLLFLGSSIGNFSPHEIADFLKYIYNLLHPGDFFLIGFDLCKDPETLLMAYDDIDGITREFNLNLLRRINAELGGNFNLDYFQHHCTYNVYSHGMESYLISLKKQLVDINELNETFHFEAFEPIHVEVSHKYLLSEIELLAKAAGFNVVKHFIDSKNYFVDSLWKK
jgi:L-histidine Nalpha-methyltransferase